MKKQEREQYLKLRLKEMKDFEQHTCGKDALYIAGVDEVGRGPLAGPVVAAAVILPRDFNISGIDDSKKLTEKRREALFPVIRKQALALGIGMADHKRIDAINILQATKEAMRDAVEEVFLQMKEKGLAVDHVLFDSMTLEGLEVPQSNIIKGDSKSLSVAAASIVAKVTRDRMMVEYADLYPGYGFEKNKGYGTKAHYEGIRTQGTCPIHRMSFLKNL